LWKRHPELGFSFFGEEAVEEVKKYAAEVTNKEVVATSPVPEQTGVHLPSKDVDNLTPQDATAPSSNSPGY